ncbi:MAG: YaiI/YqxD family protein [Chitinivibrionales bacterium]|nr:YaiI/YqxD family protein [Chitinivibrionales bacterium]
MKIIIDADACPRVIKEILCRATERLHLQLILVSNQYIRTVPLPHIRNIVVAEGADEADDKIVEIVDDEDVVITADIPLADRVVRKGGFAMDPRGDLYTVDTINQRLAMRNFMDGLRTCGVATGGPPPFNAADKQKFANQFDRFMTEHLKK